MPMSQFVPRGRHFTHQGLSTTGADDQPSEKHNTYVGKTMKTSPALTASLKRSEWVPRALDHTLRTSGLDRWAAWRLSALSRPQAPHRQDHRWH